MTDLEQMLRDIRREAELTRDVTGRAAFSARVMDALAAVPREAFVPEDLRARAWCNGPLPIGCGQTISQPYIVALMTELLETRPEHVVLEIGTGSGYQTAVLSRLVRQVYSLEIIPELARAAARRLAGLGCGNVQVRQGDGYAGLPEAAPFDAILVTAAAPHVPPPLVAQLKTGAHLVLPVGPIGGIQNLLRLTKREDGGVDVEDLLGVAFVPLTGGHGAARVDGYG